MISAMSIGCLKMTSDLTLITSCSVAEEATADHSRVSFTSDDRFCRVPVMPQSATSRVMGEAMMYVVCCRTGVYRIQP